MHPVPFEYLEHLVVLPATARGVETRFVLDSGIGLTLLSESLVAELGSEATGSAFTGRRMSGQEVSVPLATRWRSAATAEAPHRRRFRLDLNDTAVRTVEGIDETGHEYARYFTSLREVLRVATARRISSSAIPA